MYGKLIFIAVAVWAFYRRVPFENTVKYYANKPELIRTIYDQALVCSDGVPNFVYHHFGNGWLADGISIAMLPLSPTISAYCGDYVASLQLEALECGMKQQLNTIAVGLTHTPILGSSMEWVLRTRFQITSKHLEQAPTSRCLTLQRAGLIPEIPDAEFYWLNWLAVAAYWGAYLIVIGTVFTGTSIALVSAVMLRIYLKHYSSLQVEAPVAPFRKGQLEKAFETWKAANPIVVKTETGHETLAAVRSGLEAFAQKFLFRHASQIRDIGGSLSRNGSLGRRLHVCFPDLTSSDHGKRQTQSKNEVGYHKGVDCPKKGIMGYMSYTDFHIPARELADMLLAPTIIITHPFADWIGMDVKFFETKHDNGSTTDEGTLTVTPTSISMKTCKGSEYTHGYHHWKDEGVIVGNTNVVQYWRCGEYGYSSVILAVPVQGVFHRDDPYNLASSVQIKGYNLANGHVATSAGKDYIFTDASGVNIGNVLATTILRAANTNVLGVRDKTFVANLSSTLRSRFTADHQPHELFEDALLLAMMLTDYTALNLSAAKTVMPEAVYGLPLWQRLWIRFLMQLWRWTPAMFSSLQRRIWAYLRGESRQTTWMPWAWTDVYVPNYEVRTVMDKAKDAEVMNKHKPKQPFRPKGEATVSPAAPNDKCGPKPNSGKRNNKSGKASVSGNTKAASTPKPKGKQPKPAGGASKTATTGGAHKTTEKPGKDTKTTTVDPPRPYQPSVRIAITWVRQHCPELLAACRRAVDKGRHDAYSRLANVHKALREGAPKLSLSAHLRKHILDQQTERPATGKPGMAAQSTLNADAAEFQPNEGADEGVRQ